MSALPMSGRLLVIGAARSGLAALRLAHARGYEVFLRDDLLDEPTLRLRLDGTPAHVLEDAVLPEGLALVVPSPVVPPSHPLVAEALRRGIPVHSEPDFARAWFQGQVLAVTGSNGKTTTTLLAESVLRAAGIRAIACGNVGHPFSLVALEAEQPEWAVVELSSYQLELSSHLRARLALLLNISEDHLARHGSMEAYVAAKWRLAGQLTPDGALVVNGDDPLLIAHARAFAGRQLRFAHDGDAVVDARGLWLKSGTAPVIAAGAARLIGAHNLENMAAVLLAALDMGLDRETVCHALLDFAPVEHRIETVRERLGVRWINDSKATNVDSTAKALAGFAPDSVILLAGGEAKTADYQAVDALVRRHARQLITYGKDGPVIASWFRHALPVNEVEDLAAAVQLADALAQPGDAVLLSPMCASFDQFANYEARGHRFKELVAALA